MQCSTAHFGQLESYPSSWDEETKSIAFMAGVTARYYARGTACTDQHVQFTCAEVIYDRLAEIDRRGWTARADKYMQHDKSAFSLASMLAWAYGKRREGFEWRKRLAEKIEGGGKTTRTSTRSRFSTGE